MADIEGSEVRTDGGLYDPSSGLKTHAHAEPFDDPLMPIAPETFDARTSAFQLLLIEGDGMGKTVSPVTAQRLANIYGQDVMQNALNIGLIHL